ncbi:MAG: hypothetical protein LUC48_10410 [Clostridiales bacterium]|nr:hypothetical protein [Clostridiales bacterium]
MGEIAKKEAIIRELANVEVRPAYLEEQVGLSSYMKMPIAELATLGAGLASLPTALGTAAQAAGNGAGDLYRIVIPDSAVGTLVQKSGVTLGNLVGADGHTFSARARFVQVDGNAVASATFNPMGLLMATALLSVERDLAAIQERQIEILSFLKEEKKANLKGSLAYLTEEFAKYKYNLENETYIAGIYNKVQDVKQQASQNIDFYRGEIQRQAAKKDLIHGTQNVQGRMQKLLDEFGTYQLAVYLYGFASFFEVMLLRNFRSEYLHSVSSSIEGYSHQYRELYTECYNRLEGDMKTSVQSRMLGSLASISDAAGKTIEKVPIISKSYLDETLIQSSERLNRFSEKQNDEMMRQFVSMKNNNVQPFVTGVETINQLYNKPVELFFDSKNLYFKGQIA